MHQQQGPPPPKPVPAPSVQAPVAVPPPQAVPAPVAPPTPQAPPPQQNNPPPAAAFSKPEPQEQPPNSGDMVPMDESDDVSLGGGPNAPNGKKRSHSWFWFRKSPGMYMRVSKKIRKRRQNARLRHLLAPKNAMMVLHELYPELKMIVSEQVNAANQMVYTVDIEIDGKGYRGHGMSKIAAKQAGSENALKAVLLEKLTQNNVKINPEEETVDVKMEVTEQPKGSEPVSETDSGEKEKAPAAEGSEVKTEGGAEEGGQQPPFRRFPEDDVPWGSLASYALYKLFTEWQAQGFQLPASSYMAPVFQKNTLNPAVTLPSVGAAAPMKKIPEDANQKHPVQLLNQIRPGCQYSETRVGDPPNLTFTFTVSVDGQTYQGVGHNKKDAKKECAKRALEAMGVKYD